TTSLAFSPDGKRLVSANSGGAVTLWEVATGKRAGRLAAIGQEGEVGSVAFAADGRTVAAGTRYAVPLWGTTKAAPSRTLKGAGTPVAFSPDGKTLATGEWENAVHLWNVATGEEIRQMAGHGSYISALAFAPDGQTVASGSWDGNIRLWKTRSGA